MIIEIKVLYDDETESLMVDAPNIHPDLVCELLEDAIEAVCNPSSIEQVNERNQNLN